MQLINFPELTKQKSWFLPDIFHINIFVITDHFFLHSQTSNTNAGSVLPLGIMAEREFALSLRLFEAAPYYLHYFHQHISTV